MDSESENCFLEDTVYELHNERDPVRYLVVVMRRDQEGKNVEAAKPENGKIKEEKGKWYAWRRSGFAFEY